MVDLSSAVSAQWECLRMIK